jgi:hypothetical protein
MTTEELRGNLLQLIETYVIDPRVKLSVNRDDIPVKGILIQLASFMSDRVSEIDKKIIGGIAFYFC